MADFRMVKAVHQKDKDIVYGYMKRMQKLFPCSDNPYFTIVQLIQDLCLLFFRVVIESKILTDDEAIQLFEMVSKHRECQSSWNLLYRTSRDGRKFSDFYAKSDKIKNVICIISTPKHDVFGGYTSLSWDKSKNINGTIYEDDPTAFVYSLRKREKLNPNIYPVTNNGKKAIQHYRDGRWQGILSFGTEGKAFYVEQMEGTSDFKAWISYSKCEEYDLNSGCFAGTIDHQRPEEIELFQLV